MKISELIEMLEKEKSIHGDLEVITTAIEIDEDGDVAAGGGYYGEPYEIGKWPNSDKMLIRFDKVLYSSEIETVYSEELG